MTSLFACGRFSKSRGLSASVSFLPSFLFPFPLFYSLHSSPCNSLLPNCTETLATQAMDDLTRINLVPRVSLLCLPWRPREAEKRDPGNEVGLGLVITLANHKEHRQYSDAKRGKMHASASQLVLVLLLIG